ncbi:PspC domain-containing protein [Bifidobacterium sp. MA2]|uniref:PspC domain-containing protein n=1 Tax=Bifidobacterium santillanense TaxID=2809028 RepID=A0ABS5UTJ6_9BIFI|nr:PspC domain-containing protein [Bifidobacterium santillanense]MBT1173833.1 PspC domain-containing protein [Bifidobacterium santillanense]
MNDNTNLKERFFRWIRSTGVMRSDDRWIGGVGAGLAARLGWSPALTRALLLASALLFGFGAALYALAWALLPDARDGRILAEELLAGRWDWTCLGVFAVFAIALMIPGAGWVAILAAGLTLWAICQSSVRQQHGYGFGTRRGRNGGPAGPAAGPYGPYGPGYGPFNPTGPGTAGPGYAPGVGAPNGPVRGSSPAAGASQPGRPYSGNPYAAPANAAAEPPLWRGGPMDGPEMQASANGSSVAPDGTYVSTGAGAAAASAVRPSQSAPRPVQPPKPRRVRRRPAGPLVVLVTLGVTFVSAAIMLMQVGGGLTTMSIDAMFRESTVWISVVCILMGAVLVVLGARGRRSGGMIPLALVAGFTACCMIATTCVYAYAVRATSADALSGDYATVELGGNKGSSNANGMVEQQAKYDGHNYWVSDSSPKTYDRLRKGVYFKGTTYADSKANIDLSRYDRWNQSETNSYVKGCPAGQINLTVDHADVQVTLPDGCPYVFGRDGMLINEGPSLGGWGTVVRSNFVAITFPGDEPYGEWEGGAGYSWQYNGRSDDDTSFLVNFVSGNAGRVSIKYESDSELPSYTDFVKSYARDGDFYGLDDTTRKHYDIETGGSDPSSVPDATDKSDQSGKSDQSDKEDPNE